MASLKKLLKKVNLKTADLRRAGWEKITKVGCKVHRLLVHLSTSIGDFIKNRIKRGFGLVNKAISWFIDHVIFEFAHTISNWYTKN